PSSAASASGAQLLEAAHELLRRQIAANVFAFGGEYGRCASHAKILAQLVLPRHRRSARLGFHGAAELGLRDRVLTVRRAPHSFHLAPIRRPGAGARIGKIPNAHAEFVDLVDLAVEFAAIAA